MIAFKAINASFAPTKQALFYTGRPTTLKNSILCLCKSNDPDSEGSPAEGDTRKQDLLARIAMLQAQKVRLTDYLDERSAYLTQFAEEANAEFDKIGEDALRGLDEAGSRVCSIPLLYYTVHKESFFDYPPTLFYLADNGEHRKPDASF